MSAEVLVGGAEVYGILMSILWQTYLALLMRLETKHRE